MLSHFPTCAKFAPVVLNMHDGSTQNIYIRISEELNENSSVHALD